MVNDLESAVQETKPKKENLKQAIYVYLQAYCQPPGEAPIARLEVTQEGITQALYGISEQRAMGGVCRALNKLVNKGLVKRRKTGIPGKKALVFIYWLVRDNKEILETQQSFKTQELPITEARNLADKLLDMGYSLELKEQYRSAMSFYKAALELFPASLSDADIAKHYRNVLEKILRR